MCGRSAVHSRRVPCRVSRLQRQEMEPGPASNAVWRPSILTLILHPSTQYTKVPAKPFYGSLQTKPHFDEGLISICQHLGTLF